MLAPLFFFYDPPLPPLLLLLHPLAIQRSLLPAPASCSAQDLPARGFGPQSPGCRSPGGPPSCRLAPSRMIQSGVCGSGTLQMFQSRVPPTCFLTPPPMFPSGALGLRPQLVNYSVWLLLLALPGWPWPGALSSAYSVFWAIIPLLICCRCSGCAALALELVPALSRMMLCWLAPLS